MVDVAHTAWERYCAKHMAMQVEELASSYQDPQQVIDYYYGNQEMLKNIEGLVLEEAVTAAVLDAATVVDEPTTFKDIMNPSEPEASADSENS